VVFTIYELRGMESQCEQDEISNCTLEKWANYNTCMDMKPNATPKVTCKSFAKAPLW